jgi:hypothetical protein
MEERDDENNAAAHEGIAAGIVAEVEMAGDGGLDPNPNPNPNPNPEGEGAALAAGGGNGEAQDQVLMQLPLSFAEHSSFRLLVQALNHQACALFEMST